MYSNKNVLVALVVTDKMFVLCEKVFEHILITIIFSPLPRGRRVFLTFPLEFSRGLVDLAAPISSAGQICNC